MPPPHHCSVFRVLVNMLALFVAAVVGGGVLPLAYTNPSTEYTPFLYFDIDLARGLSDGETGNWVASPASIKSVLGLLLEGAKGNTAGEISQVLRLSPELAMARTNMYHYQKSLKNSESKNNGFGVQLANKLFTRKDIPLKKKFKTNALQHFGADAEESDFSNPWKLSKDINTWVSEKTDNLITDVVKPDSIKMNTQLLLVNAVYFKGDWKYGFNSHLTKDGTFYTPQGKKKVPMMTQRGHFRYGDIGRLHAKIIELPYRNPRYSMVIVLPDESISVKRLISDLPYNPIVPILDSLPSLSTEVVIPKFTASYSIDLVPILQKLGVREVFSDNADLSDLIEGRGKVSSLLHQARIDVNENGTVAAASSVGNVELLTAVERMQFIANRPFVFFIKDTESGFIFEGQVVDPSQDQVIENHAKTLDLSRPEITFRH